MEIASRTHRAQRLEDLEALLREPPPPGQPPEQLLIRQRLEPQLRPDALGESPQLFAVGFRRA
jgi:hypothetical protein